MTVADYITYELGYGIHYELITGILPNIKDEKTLQALCTTTKPKTMIKANELRIGNIIRFYNFIEPERFIKINARFFSSLAGGRPLSELKDDEEINGYHQPVELTPEILGAVGFTNGTKTIQTSFLETEFYVDLMDGDAGFNKHGLWFPCKHLHTLQNLVHSLTGQELEIDINKLNK